MTREEEKKIQDKAMLLIHQAIEDAKKLLDGKGSVNVLREGFRKVTADLDRAHGMFGATVDVD